MPQIAGTMTIIGVIELQLYYRFYHTTALQSIMFVDVFLHHNTILRKQPLASVPAESALLSYLWFYHDFVVFGKLFCLICWYCGDSLLNLLAEMTRYDTLRFCV